MKAITSGLRRSCNKIQLYLSAVFIPLIPGLCVFWFRDGDDGVLVFLVLWLILVFIFEFMLFSSSSPVKTKKIKEGFSRSVELDVESDCTGENPKQSKTIEFSDEELEEMAQRSPGNAAFVERWLKPKPVSGENSTKADLSLFFEKPCDRGSGNSIENAVTISAPSSSIGVLFEYTYIQLKCGEKDVDWRIESQSLLEGADGKPYDLMTVRLKNGTTRQFYFDISSFYDRRK
jgi:hypothetical protein